MASKDFDFCQPVAGNLERKGAFHRAARVQLKVLAQRLHLRDGSFEIRCNRGGPAVAGEVVLHADRLYVQVGQSGMGMEKSILYRRCEGRADSVGADNNYAPLEALNNPTFLAGTIRRRLCFHGDR